MIFNATIEDDVKKAKVRFDYLIEKGKSFELIEKKPKRTISQNNYLHLILSWFAVETGYTKDEVKLEIFKKHVNTDLFYDGEANVKNQVIVIERWRSTRSLDTKELTIAIDRFRNFSAKEVGIYLPEPLDLALLQQMESELKEHQNQIYL